MASLRREAMACRNVSRPSGVRTISTCGDPAVSCFLWRAGFLRLVRCRGRRGGPARDVHRGLVGGQDPLGGQRCGHRLAEPGLRQQRGHPPGGLIYPSGRGRHAQQHAHDLCGPLRRHVPVRGQHDGRRVQRRPVGHRSRVNARRLRERDRPAARARPSWQRPLRHLPGNFHVDDLRPARRRGRRPVQPGAAAAAFRGRLRVLPLIWFRIPRQAIPLVTGLTAPLAVRPALPLRLLARPPRLFRPDPLPGGRRPRIGAVHPQPALQFRQPQLQPPLPLPRR